MSRTPLLLRSSPAQGTGSYGSLPVHDPSFSSNASEIGEQEVDDVRRRDRRKGKETVLRQTETNRNSRSRHTGTSDNGSSHKGRSQRRQSRLNAEFTSPAGTSIPAGDGAKLFESIFPDTSSAGSASRDSKEDEDAEDDRDNGVWNDENPPDNSPVAITPVIALVLVHPLGRLWDRLLKRGDDPPESFEDGVLEDRASSSGEDARPTSRKRHLRLWLAQGNWNEKEHACVYISSNVSFGFAFATDVIVEQSKFYHQETSILYQLLLTISTQILGYAFAGLTRRYLVRPPSMIWPGTLMSTAMFTTMHKSENKTANGWKISRWNFFLYVWLGAFAWYFLPGLLMPALSYFSVITWFAPKNVVVANLFGVASGLGLFPMTFDWAQIAYIGSPLLTPWWAAANVVGGLVIVMWIIAPIMYYRNALYSSFMPILSSAVFDNTGKPYDVSKILTPDFLFDEKAYNSYSRVYLPITYVLAYAVQFAGLSALVTHTACWHGKDIWKQSKRSLNEQQGSTKAEYTPVASASGMPLGAETTQSRSNEARQESADGPDTSMGGEDVHCRLMRKYEDAPMSWYLCTFIVMLAIGIFVVE
ncbi:MAG: hypothetical protein M1830_000204 [Pleopsidium flavum]|nr:MAG: hypothetical protein M1830_000204 [Pleopsidium flavum]